MEQNEFQNFELKKVEAKGINVHVVADSYQEAKKWFDENVLNKNVDLSRIEAEISPDEPIYISKVEKAETLSSLLHAADTLTDIYTKGYDYDSESYVFAVMDLNIQQFTVRAENEKQAFEFVPKLLAGKDIPVTTERQVYSCGEDKVITIGGESMEVKSEHDLTEALCKQFPNGIKVLLENESIANLYEYQKYDKFDNEEELRWLKGMVEAGEDTSMARAYGLLSAELRLKPEDYGILEACEQTYWSGELSDLGVETGDNATTVMLHNEEGDLRDARIQAAVSPWLMQCLYIEGRPFKDVMNLINQ